MEININCDLGETSKFCSTENDPLLLGIVNSANVACGYHAGDEPTMKKTVEISKKNGVSIGAHPSFNDPENFGRKRLNLSSKEITKLIIDQIEVLSAIAEKKSVKVTHVKPHGALGNLAARDFSVAYEIAKAVKCIDPDLAYLAISGTESEKAARASGIKVYAEIFADRGYLSTGQLVPRGQEGAMIESTAEAAKRIVYFLKDGKMPVIDGDPIPLKAQSICVHGDSRNAVAMAGELKKRLIAEGVEIKSFI